MAVPPPVATVDVAAVVTVISKVVPVTLLITCSILSSPAGTPPTSTAPLKVTRSPSEPPCPAIVTTRVVEVSVVAKQLSVSVVVNVALIGVVSYRLVPTSTYIFWLVPTPTIELSSVVPYEIRLEASPM
jgi:hypothetical protein